MFANVLNMHQTSSSLVIGHAVYSTCPLISCIGQRYQIEVIVEETSTYVIDDCITLVMSANVIVGYNNIDLVLSLVKIVFPVELWVISPLT